MSDRQAQWLRFYEAALTGSAGLSYPDDGEVQKRVRSAERIADAAMARLDARDFPPNKAEES